jgi:hypothetical protein
MLGAFESAYFGGFGLRLPVVILASTGVILAAVYLLWMFQKVFYGPITVPANKRLKDLKPWEIAMVGLLVIFAVWGGIFPNTFLKPMEASVGATRMMALNPAGLRPSWKDLNTEIVADGSLVATKPRTQEQLGEEPIVDRILSPANLHPVTSKEALRSLNTEMPLSIGADGTTFGSRKRGPEAHGLPGGIAPSGGGAPPGGPAAGPSGRRPGPGVGGPPAGVRPAAPRPPRPMPPTRGGSGPRPLPRKPGTRSEVNGG